MKKLLILLLPLLALSCRKSNDVRVLSPKGIEFFSSAQKMSDAVKKSVGDDFGIIKTFSIKRVDYFEDKEKSLGLVTYEVNGQEHSNIMFLTTAETNKTYKCTATDCLCRMDIYPDENGGYVYECGGCATNCHWEVSETINNENKQL